MTRDGTGQLLPTATGFAAKQAIAALWKHNVATAPLLHRAGLPERDFAGVAGNRNPAIRRVSAVAQGTRGK